MQEWGKGGVEGSEPPAVPVGWRWRCWMEVWTRVQSACEWLSSDVCVRRPESLSDSRYREYAAVVGRVQNCPSSTGWLWETVEGKKKQDSTVRQAAIISMFLLFAHIKCSWRHHAISTVGRGDDVCDESLREELLHQLQQQPITKRSNYFHITPKPQLLGWRRGGKPHVAQRHFPLCACEESYHLQPVLQSRLTVANASRCINFVLERSPRCSMI